MTAYVRHPDFPSRVPPPLFFAYLIMIKHIPIVYLIQLLLLSAIIHGHPIRRREVVTRVVATKTVYANAAGATQSVATGTTAAGIAAVDTATAVNLAAAETTTTGSSNFLSQLLAWFQIPGSSSSTTSIPTSTTTTSTSSTPTSTSSTPTSAYTTPTTSIPASSITTTASSQALVQVSATYTTATSIPSDASSNTVNKLWGRFWLSGNSAWNDDDAICGTGSFEAVVVWDQAVIGRAITNLQDSSGIATTIANLNEYENSNLQVFSASTAGDDDIYSDDNAQVAWVYIDAYKVTNNGDYLTKATNIVKFLMNETDSKGGVIWQYKGTYIASISTAEAALAAVRLYELTPIDSLLTFAQNCMNYMFQYLQDPSDKLFYDGLDMNDYSDVNKGKLTYTVGTALSTLAYLYKYTGNDYWKTQAIQLATAATNQNGAFYNGDKIWNNKLQYVHLLYVGFADLFNVGGWDSSYSDFKSEVLRQGQFVYDYLQDPDDVHLYYDAVTSATPLMYNAYSKAYSGGSAYSSSLADYCTGTTTTKKNLMDNASAAQIVYALSQIQ